MAYYDKVISPVILYESITRGEFRNHLHSLRSVRILLKYQIPDICVAYKSKLLKDGDT
jgi:hypothetical protein